MLQSLHHKLYCIIACCCVINVALIYKQLFQFQNEICL